MEGKRGNDLQALTEIADSDVLIVDTGEGTRKITYGALCAAVKNTLGIREVVESTNITEPGFLMDGKTASEAFAELYSNTELVTGQLTNVEGTNGNIFGNTLKKCGNVVYLTLFISGIHISDQAPIATMPKDFAPKDKSAQVLGLAVINGETHAITFAINTSGIIFNSWTTSEITAAYIVGTYII